MHAAPMRAAALASVLLMLAPVARAHETPARLPLGDGRVSDSPRRGYVMACQSRFGPGAPGAFRDGDWIAGGTWDPAAKPVVEGEVAWPNARIIIAVEGDRRVVRANGLPSHATGEFPIRPGTRAYDYDRNLNRIAEQTVLLSLPASPPVALQPSCVPMGMVGFALSGVAIFNAMDAGGRDAPAHEIQDRCNGHPERRGQYHYHNWSPCLTVADPEAPVGWMLDGFPILAPAASGPESTNEGLDACHGGIGPVRIDGQLVTTYRYRFTREYPYTIGCFHGEVDPALLRPQGPAPGGPGRPPRPGG